MTLPTVVRRHRPIAYLLATVVGVATCLVASPGPAEAHIPPLTLCISVNEGDTRFQTFVDGTEDMIIWRCTKGREIAGFPPFYYWKHQIVSTDPVTELKKRAKSAVIRVFKEGVWQGSLQSGLAAFGQSDVDRAHIRYVGSFDIQGWDGTPLNRDINVHMVAKHSLNGGGTWSTCGDTGWKATSSPKSEFSVEFYKLTSSCNGTVQVFTRARFMQVSTNTWWTSNFLATEPVVAPPPPPPV